MKSKLKRFAVIANRDNVIEYGKDLYTKIKGNWNSLFFKNEQPITIELACGRGEYSVGLAGRFPERNFIGVDMKGDRLWKGSTLAVDQSLANVGFLRTQIVDLEVFFLPGEVDEIWLTFPDPRPKKRDVKRRLTSPRFMDLFKKLLKPGSYFRLKTDNTELFDYTLDQLNMRSDIEDFRHTYDLYNSELREECFDIKTRYEEIFSAKGEMIKYLRFRFVER
ncbi:MAG: tRNA (guanosine(46)-N7)-methyltransferase TrmB [Bacteroidota bacterium]